MRRDDLPPADPPTAPPAPPTTPAGRPRLFTRLGPRELTLLAAVTAAAPLSIDVYLPAYPELAAELGASETQVQLTLTACLLGVALGQLVIGPLADRLGRRAPIVAGIAAWSVASLLAALAPTLELLVVARFLQGFVAAAGIVAARATLRDLASGQQLARAMARLFLVLGLVPMLAPVLGSVILVWTSWRGIFVVLAVTGVGLALVSAAFLVETLPAEQRRPVPARSILATYGRLLADRSFVPPALVAAFSFAGLFTWINSSSFVLQEQYGVSPLGYGLVFALMTAAVVAGSQLSPVLTARVGLLPVLRTGPLVAAAAVGVAALVAATGGAPAALVVAGVVVAMAVTGLAMPAGAAFALSGQPPVRAGLASGLLGVLQFTSGGLASPVAGLFGEVSATSMTVTMAALFLAAAGAAALARRG